jgi:nucleoside-diphosphate-sugar epimerase
MSSERNILILGGNSFVGINLLETLKDQTKLYHSTRATGLNSPGQIYFDYNDEKSWENVKSLQPDVLINCIGYGVLATEKDIQATFEINYLAASRFYRFLAASGFGGQVIHIGSSFEYDMEVGAIFEDSRTLPRSMYGISKLMATKFLLETQVLPQIVVLRAFNLFGPHEHDSRLFPSLIRAQLFNEPMPLTSGIQKRDFVYIKDFTNFVRQLIFKHTLEPVPNLINVGNGRFFSVREMGDMVAITLPEYNHSLWEWNKLPQRVAEGPSFYNASTLAVQYGFNSTAINLALKDTVSFFSDKYKKQHVAS